MGENNKDIGENEIKIGQLKRNYRNQKNFLFLLINNELFVYYIYKLILI